MLSLAAFRYRNVLTAAGGPIEKVVVSEMEVLGERRYLANAYLAAEFAGPREANLLYSQANGSGTSISPMIAKFMAISEAMERWAHWELHQSGRYGFETDPSSNGLAAFPGLWKRQARSGALMEAAERFNLLHWWEGRLAAHEADTRWPGVRAVVIDSSAPGVTAILFKRSPEGVFSYGHAAAQTFEAACQKAAAEMDRHARVVARFARDHGGGLDQRLPESAHPIERRTLFFSRDEGHELFLKHVRAVPSMRAEPRLVYDGPVPGPWSKYADVWRVVYEPPNRRFLGTDETYFML